MLSFAGENQIARWSVLVLQDVLGGCDDRTSFVALVGVDDPESYSEAG